MIDLNFNVPYGHLDKLFKPGYKVRTDWVVTPNTGGGVVDVIELLPDKKNFDRYIIGVGFQADENFLENLPGALTLVMFALGIDVSLSGGVLQGRSLFPANREINQAFTPIFPYNAPIVARARNQFVIDSIAGIHLLEDILIKVNLNQLLESGVPLYFCSLSSSVTSTSTCIIQYVEGVKL